MFFSNNLNFLFSDAEKESEAAGEEKAEKNVKQENSSQVEEGTKEAVQQTLN